MDADGQGQVWRRGSQLMRAEGYGRQKGLQRRDLKQDGDGSLGGWVRKGNVRRTGLNRMATKAAPGRQRWGGRELTLKLERWILMERRGSTD